MLGNSYIDVNIKTFPMFHRTQCHHLIILLSHIKLLLSFQLEKQIPPECIMRFDKMLLPLLDINLNINYFQMCHIMSHDLSLPVLSSNVLIIRILNHMTQAFCPYIGIDINSSHIDYDIYHA